MHQRLRHLDSLSWWFGGRPTGETFRAASYLQRVNSVKRSRVGTPRLCRCVDAPGVSLLRVCYNHELEIDAGQHPHRGFRGDAAATTACRTERCLVTQDTLK